MTGNRDDFVALLERANLNTHRGEKHESANKEGGEEAVEEVPAQASAEAAASGPGAGKFEMKLQGSKAVQLVHVYSLNVATASRTV